MSKYRLSTRAPSPLPQHLLAQPDVVVLAKLLGRRSGPHKTVTLAQFCDAFSPALPPYQPESWHRLGDATNLLLEQWAGMMDCKPGLQFLAIETSAPLHEYLKSFASSTE